MIEYLVVHCSASPKGRGDNAETIHQWHQSKGWDGIGYNSVILEDGTWQAGRPVYWRPAHVRGMNAVSLGVCLIGMGGDATEQQLVTLRARLDFLLTLHPGARVVGHSDLDPTGKPDCPGFNVVKWFYGADDRDAAVRLALGELQAARIQLTKAQSRYEQALNLADEVL